MNAWDRITPDKRAFVGHAAPAGYWVSGTDNLHDDGFDVIQSFPDNLATFPNGVDDAWSLGLT